jgi:non-heme chloroperoxidase
MCPRLAARHGLGTYHKVRVEAHKLNWADTLMLVLEASAGWCKPAVSTSAHGKGPRAANSADQAVGVGGRALKRQQDLSQIWPTRNTSRPIDTVSRELASELSHSLRERVMTSEQSSGPSSDQTITEHELEECKRANATGRQPVMFVHGLWLLPSSWDRWAALFEENGYAALTPGWPDDPETVEEAKAHPEVFAGKSIGQVADHFETIIRGLDKKPAVVGHSFGGLLTQILAGRGLAAVSVAIDPAQFRGVLPLPISALKSAFPVLGNPANRNRAIPLTYDQFQYAFANAVSEEEAKQLYETYAVPTAGKPLFQAAAANLNPWTEAKVDTKNPERGPLLIISGEMDHTVPPAVVKAAYKQQQDNEGVTEIVEIKDRGHALTIDSGWREVADTALAFVKRFT